MLLTMTAQPSPEECDPEDPAEILDHLPDHYQSQFRAEYALAVEQARRPEQYRVLQQLLKLWRLRAVAYSDLGYADRLSGQRGSLPYRRSDRAPHPELPRLMSYLVS